MKFLGRIFRYIVWLVVTAGIAWVMKKAFEGAASRHNVNGTPERGRVDTALAPKALFRDPVCGTYIAEDISCFYQQGAETLHFCSRDCLEHYRRDHQLEHHIERPVGDRPANHLAAGT
ncbi:MAG: hypothetical protein ACYC92_01265 [Candidatus Acidiferrales bacterium]